MVRWYHALIRFPADHPDLGSRDRPSSRDLNTAGENTAPKYCCSSHKQHSAFLTPVPSCDPAVERENGDVGLGGQPVNG